MGAVRVERAAVIGAGSWGTTVASLLANSVGTTLWCRRAELASRITADHRNDDYLAGIDLNPALVASHDIADVVNSADVIVMAVPSIGFRDALVNVAAHVRSGVPVVSLSKGLEASTLKRMTEVIADVLPTHPRAVLTGPNLAREIAMGQPAASVVAIEDLEIGAELQRIFSTQTLRIYTNPDVAGQIAGVVKNVIAIASGMAMGMGLGDNTRATLITRGLAEISRLAIAMGGQQVTLAGLAGMGDLIATCSSTQSRNNTVGMRLGRGESLESIMSSMSMVAEGVKSSLSVLELASRYGVDMPITEQVAAVCHRGVGVSDAIRALMTRSSTSEFR